MKKRIATLLCTAVLSLGLTAAPAMASAGPFSPIEVETYTYGPFDELRVNKVYQLSVADDPSGIPTEDFEQGGRRYYLLGMTIASADNEAVTYTAIFGSVELAERPVSPSTRLFTSKRIGLAFVQTPGLDTVVDQIIVDATPMEIADNVGGTPAGLRQQQFPGFPFLRWDFRCARLENRLSHKGLHRLGKRKALDFDQIVQSCLAADPTGKPVPFAVTNLQTVMLSGAVGLQGGRNSK